MTPAWKFVLVLAGMLAANIAPALIVGAEGWSGWRLLSWLATILLFLICLVIVGERMASDWRGVLVDKRNVMSLSRLQLVIWTVVVVSGVVTAGIWNVAINCPDPLNLNIPPQIWAIIGISGTSLVATPLILDQSTQVSTNPPGSAAWAWSDIFLGDKTSNDDKVDLSKVQQFFFTLVVVAVFMMQLGTVFASAGKATFPAIDTGFVALLGLSHTAYLVHKAS